MSAPGQGPAPENDHRADREAGAIVYPVYSRRSGGLSLGVNLFPDAKLCSFDCPYCEVFPFSSRSRFSLGALERGLSSAIADAAARGLPVKDICFSGNGEPTLFPDFPAALSLAAEIGRSLVPDASLVAISNASTLSDAGLSDFLVGAAASRADGGMGLDLWLKFDAATAAWYRRIDRCAIPLAFIFRGVDSFLSRAPATLQTMLCAIDGMTPPADESRAWLERLAEMARTGNVRRVHLYGKARPAPEDPKAERLPLDFLEDRASAARAVLAEAGYPGVPVEVFF